MDDRGNEIRMLKTGGILLFLGSVLDKIDPKDFYVYL